MESCDGKLWLSKPGASEAANIESRGLNEVFRFEPVKTTPLFTDYVSDINRKGSFLQKLMFCG